MKICYIYHKHQISKHLEALSSNDRDLNASINILRVGTSTLAGEIVRAIS